VVTRRPGAADPAHRPRAVHDRTHSTLAVSIQC
jgi:hypothetical protein